MAVIDDSTSGPSYTTQGFVYAESFPMHRDAVFLGDDELQPEGVFLVVFVTLDAQHYYVVRRVTFQFIREKSSIDPRNNVMLCQIIE